MRVGVHGPGGTEDLDPGTGPLLLALPGAKAARPGALLAVADGAAYLQPIDGEVAVFLNGHRLAASHWLRDGDRLRLGEAEVKVSMSGERLLLQTGADVRVASAPGELQPEPPPPAPAPRQARIGAAWVGATLLLLAGVVWFVFSARMLYVEIRPAPQKFGLEGALPALRLGEGWLALPGAYTLRAELEGYRSLAQPVEITRADNQRVTVAMEMLPGRLTVETPGVAGAMVLVDGREAGRTPLADLELPQGEHAVVLRAEGYAEFSASLRIEGMGRRQNFSAALVPAFAPVSARSDTAEATLWVDGRELGTLPLTAQLAAGRRSVEIRAPRHKPWKTQLEVVAGQAQSIGPVSLALADALLRVESEPAGASIAVDGRYAGTAPATLALSPDREHRVSASKAGHGAASQTVRLAPGEEASLRLALSAETGPVTLQVEPQDAQLGVEGRSLGAAAGTHRLPAAPTLLEITREGYEPAQLWVTPKPGFEQTLSVKLRAKGASAEAALPKRISAPDGTVMLLVRPGTFTMGASRRDPGQRANEVLHEVQLSRPYYLGATEVTNAQFQKYRPGHRSGRFGAATLDAPDHPAVNLRWEDAAGYCNWLNEAAQLPQSYAKTGAGLAPVTPLRHGFRLPTEAEWAWAARRAGVDAPTRFAWGDAMPPPAGSGNFADRSVSGDLADALKDYDDGFAGTAPVGRFKPGAAGFYDLAGNAAEWVHDFYGIPSGAKPEMDPAGPATGKHHVIRGSSWMQASVTALRWSYRDYGSEPRPDVGFRCARYATEAP